ncbi:MAG: hypothetical protein HWD90_00325 [Campylobacteraceae bacterium]|nr:hypothetical protein [Campylobacteraceae bacterium]
MIKLQKNKGTVINLEPCRHCKREIETKKRQCPYCGTLNPTVKIKEIAIGIAAVTIIMYAVSFFINSN